ncbi:MAG: DUF1566 domain-containing protein [Bacteroidota bacterium]|nr:DUF1566 domain-containing protein [Bacteroidota bacterium]
MKKTQIYLIVLLSSFIFINSCSKDKTETQPNTKPLDIGVDYQGGKIAYILQPGDPGYISGQIHGLIASPGNLSTGVRWHNTTYIIIGDTATALGAGMANTNAIVNSQGAGSYAAKLCYDFVSGGYSDWYLPSKNELNKLYLNKTAIGGFSAFNYWSSSESDVNNAKYQIFSNGSQLKYDKNIPLYVRAVRSF